MSIQKIGDTYRVCVAGMCKDHQQEWQAKVFYHQMLETQQFTVNQCNDLRISGIGNT
jgi:hypothetical protein